MAKHSKGNSPSKPRPQPQPPAQDAPPNAKAAAQRAKDLSKVKGLTESHTTAQVRKIPKNTNVTKAMDSQVTGVDTDESKESDEILDLRVQSHTGPMETRLNKYVDEKVNGNLKWTLGIGIPLILGMIALFFTVVGKSHDDIIRQLGEVKKDLTEKIRDVVTSSDEKIDDVETRVKDLERKPEERRNTKW